MILIWPPDTGSLAAARTGSFHRLGRFGSLPALARRLGLIGLLVEYLQPRRFEIVVSLGRRDIADEGRRVLLVVDLQPV